MSSLYGVPEGIQLVFAGLLWVTFAGLYGVKYFRLKQRSAMLVLVGTAIFGLLVPLQWLYPSINDHVRSVNPDGSVSIPIDVPRLLAYRFTSLFAQALVIVGLLAELNGLVRPRKPRV